MIKKHRGFTLVELIVVIGIMGLLMAIVTANFNKARSKARDGKRVADIAIIQGALAHYYDRCGTYPSDIDINNTSGTCPPGINIATFLSQVPRPPYPLSKMGGTSLDTAAGTDVSYRYGVNDTLTEYVL